MQGKGRGNKKGSLEAVPVGSTSITSERTGKHFQRIAPNSRVQAQESYERGDILADGEMHAQLSYSVLQSE
jgi:hypothetical protein